MFTLAETTTWTADDVLLKIQEVLPEGWALKERFSGYRYYADLFDQGGSNVWSGEQSDPRVLFLDCLGWLSLRGHKTKNPAWRARSSEVPLHRPPVSVATPDPPDLDPEEIAAVYKTSR